VNPPSTCDKCIVFFSLAVGYWILSNTHMTHEVEFYASQAALWHVRYSLSTFPKDEEDDNPYAYLAAGTACILCCSAALEALVNEFFVYEETISPWDELKLRSKINVLFELKGEKANWGAKPLQKVAQLIKVRNWLAHHKEPYLGLTGGDGSWVTDARGHSAPRVHIQQELKKDSIQNYYNAVRDIGKILAILWGNEYTVEWIESEDYWPLAH